MLKKVLILILIIGAGLVAWLMFIKPAAPAPSDWLTFTDEAGVYTFRYPAQVGVQYLHAQEWPPQVDLLEGTSLVCEIPAQATAHAGIIEEKRIAGREYCVSAQAEGAAGSTYTDYAYTTLKDKQVARLRFTIKELNCGNYDEPKQSACEAEQEAFSPDQLASQIVESLAFTSQN